MTEENKRANIAEELARAAKSSEAATLLAAHGFHSEVVSGLYYSVLHLVRALLLTKGLQPRTHEGALTLLSLHFVKDGPLESGHAHVFSRLMKCRQDADYNPASIFSHADFTAFQEDAQNLSDRILELLRATGYPPRRPS